MVAENGFEFSSEAASAQLENMLKELKTLRDSEWAASQVKESAMQQFLYTLGLQGQDLHASVIAGDLVISGLQNDRGEPAIAVIPMSDFVVGRPMDEVVQEQLRAQGLNFAANTAISNATASMQGAEERMAEQTQSLNDLYSAAQAEKKAHAEIVAAGADLLKEPKAEAKPSMSKEQAQAHLDKGKQQLMESLGLVPDGKTIKDVEGMTSIKGADGELYSIRPITQMDDTGKVTLSLEVVGSGGVNSRIFVNPDELAQDHQAALKNALAAMKEVAPAISGTLDEKIAELKPEAKSKDALVAISDGLEQQRLMSGEHEVASARSEKLQHDIKMVAVHDLANEFNALDKQIAALQKGGKKDVDLSPGLLEKIQELREKLSTEDGQKIASSPEFKEVLAKNRGEMGPDAVKHLEREYASRTSQLHNAFTKPDEHTRGMSPAEREQAILTLAGIDDPQGVRDQLVAEKRSQNKQMIAEATVKPSGEASIGGHAYAVKKRGEDLVLDKQAAIEAGVRIGQVVAVTMTGNDKQENTMLFAVKEMGKLEALPQAQQTPGNIVAVNKQQGASVG